MTGAASAPASKAYAVRELFSAQRLTWQRLGSVSRVIGWTLLLSIAISTQFLFQPFIWRNWDLVDILPAWFRIACDRLTVAICIAASLAVFNRWSSPRLGTRMMLRSFAIVCGAVVGELLLQQIGGQDDRQDLLSLVGRIVRWTLVAGSVSALIYFWQYGTELAEAAETTRLDQARIRRVAASSQLETLKRQIEPHFLFNTLATIRRLSEIDPAKSAHLIGRLIDYMSGTLGDHDGQSTLRAEVALVLAYLDVCAARMGGRLTVRCELPVELEDIEFPPLVLATLAENAIKHGIFPRDGGEVVISAAAIDGRIEVAITDDGVGLGDQPGGSGIGLANISERLQLLYGVKASLRLAGGNPRGVQATVILPDSRPPC